MAYEYTHLLKWLRSNQFFSDQVKIDYIKRACVRDDNYILKRDGHYLLQAAIRPSKDEEKLSYELLVLENDYDETPVYTVDSYYVFEDITSALSRFDSFVSESQGG